MDYSYNYGYLKQFMESHRLLKKDLLEALDCYDYVSLNKWLDGKVPMHITALLRFCNYYNVPMSNFFVDGDGMPCDFEPVMPDSTAQLLPTDGYGIKEGKGRGIVETRVPNIKATSNAQKAAVAEGLERKAGMVSRRDAAIAQMSAGEMAATALPDPTMAETLLKMQLEHTNEIRQMEQAHREKEDGIRKRFDDERDRLMNIIEQQAREIARLSSPMSMKAYNRGDNNQINMVTDREAEIH